MNTDETIRACDARRHGGKHFRGPGEDITPSPALSAIVPVVPVDFHGEMTPAVNARRLHAFLGVSIEFSHWIKRRIDHYGFQIGRDLIVLAKPGENAQGGRPAEEYHISLDMAKELAMVENNREGRKARRYFIDAEKRLRAVVSAAPSPAFAIPQTFAQALRLAAEQHEQITALQTVNAILEPKAEALDAIAGADGLHTMQEAANICGIGRNTLFRHLRARGHLQHSNQPYRRHIDS